MRQRLGQWWSGLSTRGKVVTAVAVLIVFAAIGSSSRSPSPDVTATPTSTPTTAAAQTEQPTHTLAPAETAGPSPTVEPPLATPIPTAALAFEPIDLRGRGSKIARFDIPEDVAAIAEITNEGASNFVVWTVNASGEKTDLLVNEIGAYTGTRLFDVDDHSVAFKVESSGRWTITIKPISLAPKWDADEKTAGNGDTVLLVEPAIAGFAASTITHNGNSNFAVWSFGENGQDLLVNEIGSYRGEVLWPSGTLLVEITADGKWTIGATD